MKPPEPRLRLRALEPDDLEVLYAIENDTTLWRLSNTTVPYSKECLRQFILTTTADIFADKQLHLVVETAPAATEPAAAPAIVGIVSLVNFDPRNSRAEVAIVILEKYRHRGYATHILSHLIDYTERFLHIHSLYAVIPADNSASRQLFHHVGFTESATLDHWLATDNGYAPAVVAQKVMQTK